MRYFTFIFIFMVIVNIQVFAQPDTLWTQTFGGEGWDFGSSIQQTTDCGYIIGGRINSSLVGGGMGPPDFNWTLWLTKTDINGDEEWSHVFNEKGWEQGGIAQQTNDGGYVITASDSDHHVALFKLVHQFALIDG
ncbi:MAG: hypothetical protein P9L92_11035 [Candidatus Electryonea clarkiae]|nr:hypothetical protein [Candidatus Electryonea clarkiae]MDP8287814.1 hypothetical protein [Candidatus Electryonea clarkiae]